MNRAIGLALLLAGGSWALYDAHQEVVDLTAAKFDSMVVKSDEVWIVEFYAPWCGHCQALVPEFAKAAKALKGVVRLGAVDATKHQELAAKFDVRSYPTIKVFGSNKLKPENYQGQRTARAFADAGLAAAKSAVFAKLDGKQSKQQSGKGNAGDVVELTEANFDETVVRSEDMWLVEFFAPWCGHCKNLEPHWAQAATELKGKVKLGALDATAHQSKAGEYGVQGYPTIKFFPAGKKDRSSAEEYNGGRTADDIVQWALRKVAESVPPPEVLQILDPDRFKEECTGKPLCVISVLPHILDCQSSCRDGYLDVLRALGDKYRQKMWGWVWTEAGAQPELESALDIGGFGYPAMAVVNAKKMKYSLLRGSYSKDGINEFLRDLSFGRGSTAPIKGDLPQVVASEPWDGKDGELPAEEDIDLSDVSLDDKDEL